jgi:hypothetical protein
LSGLFHRPIAHIANNKMNVVGHTNERIALHIGEFIFQLRVPPHHHFADGVHLHFTLVDSAEQTVPVLGTDGDKIGAGLGVIVTLQSDRTTILFRRTVRH